MKKAFLSILSTLSLCACGASAEFLSFASVSEERQAYVVESLASTLTTADVVVLHSRSDEVFRDDGEMDETVSLVLNVWPIRFPVVLKGRESILPYSVGYIYKPDWYVPGLREIRTERKPSARKGGRGFLPPYFPTLDTTDDLMRLVFLARQTVPIKARLLQRDSGARRQMIYDDANAMEETAFTEKYNLTAVFSNQVYSVVEGCIFHVDLPVPKLPRTALMEANAAMLAADQARLSYFQRNSNLIHLSPEEVSEIVYIAYLLDGGAERYAEASRRAPELLLPIEKPEFRTAIGRQVFAAVAGKIPESKTGGQ